MTVNLGIKIPFNFINAVQRRFGGPRTDQARLAGVSHVKLWDIVLDRRAKDQIIGRANPVVENTLKNLRRAGFEDPLEINTKVKARVKLILAKNRPAATTPLAKAVLLFSALLPAADSFICNGETKLGLPASRGGLEIPYNDNPDLPLRRQYGNFLPKQLLSLTPTERFAVCLEYSFLLVTLFRAAGLTAQIRGEDCHAYVIAVIDGQKYRFDAVEKMVEKTDAQPIPDRESVAMHYFFKGDALAIGNNPVEALYCYSRALELNPSRSDIWYSKGRVLADLGRVTEADLAFNKANEI